MKLFIFALSATTLSYSKMFNCQPGQTTDPNSICIEPRYIQGCHQYASTLTCYQCQYKYKLNESGLCEYQKETFQPCCLEKQNNKCTKCNTGLLLASDGKCQQNRIIGCLQKNWDGTCVNCAADYKLEQGRCQSGIKDCREYLKNSAAQTCVRCKVNYSLINNACLKNKILGCQFEKDYKCQRCLNPFKIKDDHCQIQNCSAYNDFGCTACQCGYFLNPRNTCQEIQPGCIRYQRGICNDCQPLFKLRGGICVIEGCEKMDFLTCQRCSADYEPANGGCKLKNCISWDHGVCYACDQGFLTSQGKCVVDPKSRLASE